LAGVGIIGEKGFPLLHEPQFIGVYERLNEFIVIAGTYYKQHGKKREYLFHLGIN
jgi:hypothetical protein